jgi:hypothetical protein
MKSLVYTVFLFMTFMNVYGQSWEVKISGNVIDMPSKKAMENIPVVLMENLDTIDIQNSSSEGEFLFEATFNVESDYYIFLNVEFQNSRQSWIKLHAKGDSNIVQEYRLDLAKLRIIHDRFDTGIYYEKNETKEYQNFDLNYFKKMIVEYPQICIRFVQTVNPEEKKSVAMRRKKHFLKELQTSGVNMNQIIFTDEIFRLDITNANDKRSRIEGVVYSMDGNCN